jgi:hypothetical protein
MKEIVKVTKKSRFSSLSRKKLCNYRKVMVSMSSRDENRASVGKFGVSMPCHNKNGASVGKFQVFMSDHYRNHVTVGKFMVFRSNHEENCENERNLGFPCPDMMGIVQVRDIQGF